MKFPETGSKICREMDSQRTPLPFGEDIEIPSRLCRFHCAESEFTAGNRKVERIVAGDLQEYARVRAAFVSLTG